MHEIDTIPLPFAPSEAKVIDPFDVHVTPFAVFLQFVVRCTQPSASCASHVTPAAAGIDPSADTFTTASGSAPQLPDVSTNAAT